MGLAGVESGKQASLSVIDGVAESKAMMTSISDQRSLRLVSIHL